MSSEVYKIFGIKYARLRNEGLRRKEDITDWEYEWANLSFPDGYRPQPEDFKPYNRRDKTLTISDFWELD